MTRALPQDWKKPDNQKLESRELVNHDDLIEMPSIFACVVKWTCLREVMGSNGVLVSVSNSHVLNGVNLAVNTPSTYGEFKKVGMGVVWDADCLEPWKSYGFGLGRIVRFVR